jgi:hypothetical protein
LGHWPAVIASRLRFAEALERRGDPDDIDTAQEQRTEAAEEAATLAVGVAPVPAPVSVPSGVAVCTRHGVKWRIEVGTRSALVDHSVGMLHLSVLIANPGVEIPAVDLVAGMDVLGQAARTSGMPAQQVLDRAAIQQYRHCLAQLREQIDELESDGNHEAVARAHAERNWLLAELGVSTGLGGRPRAFSDNKERARLAVSRAIRRAIAYAERADPVIGAHLRTTVHTGARCWYRLVH